MPEILHETLEFKQNHTERYLDISDVYLPLVLTGEKKFFFTSRGTISDSVLILKFDVEEVFLFCGGHILLVFIFLSRFSGVLQI